MLMTPHNYHYFANANNFSGIYDQICRDMLSDGADIDTGHWQAIAETAMTKSRELQYVNIVMDLPPTAGSLAAMIEPNLPWADEHFAERVGGKPLNPPPSHENWPFAQKGNEEHTDSLGAFSHSYPERLWPKFAGGKFEGFEKNEDGGPWVGHEGVRYKYGDLSDAVELLVKHPHSRQCFVPLWFPEDLYAAAVEEVRVPCTLGYHFMLRRDRLHCLYPMRSCDLLRYFRDDAYMAGRLLQWMLEQARTKSHKNGSEDKSPWDLVEVGQLTMVISSLHIFDGDVPNLVKKYSVERGARHASRK